MKKVLTIVALVAAISVQANAQSILGSLLGGDSSAVADILSSLTGSSVVYSSPVSLNGTYSYAGSAVSLTQSNGNVINSLAGTAVANTIETRVDATLAKLGIQPGSMSITFDRDAETFIWYIAGLPLPGTYKVGNLEETVTLTFGKSMQFFSLTGNLQSGPNGATVLFPANRTAAFLKKVAARLGEKDSSIASITKLAEDFDNYKIGFKLTK